LRRGRVNFSGVQRELVKRAEGKAPNSPESVLAEMVAAID
jgi:hypothetical protein